MKQLLLIAALSVGLIACSKDDDTAPTPAPTKLELLTGKQWQYTELYINATAHKTGTLAYKRGNAGNAQNQDNTRTFFWQDGVFDEVDGVSSTHTKMQWAFSNADNTKYKMIWPTGNTEVEIILLTDTKFEWFNPTQKMSAVMTATK